MATIIEALENARINLVNNGNVPFARLIGGAQLNNAIGLLEKGYGIYEDVEELIGEGDVSDVPEKSDIMQDFAKQEKKETSIDFLIHMLKKYEGHDIIERWQMEDDFSEWYNNKFKQDEVNFEKFKGKSLFNNKQDES